MNRFIFIIIIALIPNNSHSSESNNCFSEKELNDICNKIPDQDEKETCLYFLNAGRILQIRHEDITERNILRFNKTKGVFLGLKIDKSVNQELLKKILTLQNITVLVIENRSDVSMILEALRPEIIETLFIVGGVTDIQLTLLTKFKKLKSLVIEGPVTNITIDKVRNLKNLIRITFQNFKITDDGISKLAPLSSKLKTLNFFQNDKITDEAVKHLIGFKNLTSITLYRTKITPKGLAELKRKLPKALIW